MTQLPDGAAAVRWASRVNPSRIRRLYETDARGIVDEELIDEVGYALYARCRSILRATEAQHGRVTCPQCEHVIDRGARDFASRDQRISCERCGWHVIWRDYLKTYQDKHLVGGGATELHRAHIAQFDRARTPQQKMLAIDRLIHTFHWELKNRPGRSAARELIYAKNAQELIDFLDSLTLGTHSTPGLQQQRANWEAKLERSIWHNDTGVLPNRAKPPAK